MDMMVTFHIVMQQTKEELGSVRITREIAKKWNVDTEQLFELAMAEYTKVVSGQDLYDVCDDDEMMEENVNEWEGFSITPNPTRQNRNLMLSQIQWGSRVLQCFVSECIRKDC